MAPSTLLMSQTGSRTGTRSESGTLCFSGGQIYGGDYVKDIYKMGTNFNFSKIDQKLNERRSGHRSIVNKNQVIHVGGKCEQNVEIWYLKSNGDFEVISSESIFWFLFSLMTR